MLRILIFTDLIVLLIGCNQSNNWSNVLIDNNILKETEIVNMNYQPEILSEFEDPKIFKKRTSTVKVEIFENSNCRAYFLNSDTLNINIGKSDGKTGNGFNIKYINNQFKIQPYFFTCTADHNEGPKVSILNQSLVLNKAQFSKDDSIYGKVKFEMIVSDEKNHKVRKFGNGFFRAKIM